MAIVDIHLRLVALLPFYNYMFPSAYHLLPFRVSSILNTIDKFIAAKSFVFVEEFDKFVYNMRFLGNDFILNYMIPNLYYAPTVYITFLYYVDFMKYQYSYFEI